MLSVRIIIMMPMIEQLGTVCCSGFRNLALYLRAASYSSG